MADEFLDGVRKDALNHASSPCGRAHKRDSAGDDYDDDNDGDKDGQTTPSRKSVSPSSPPKAKARAGGLTSGREDSESFHTSPPTPRGDSSQRNRKSGDRDRQQSPTRRTCESRDGLFWERDSKEGKDRKFHKNRVNLRQLVLNLLEGRGPLGYLKLRKSLDTQPGTKFGDIGISVSGRLLVFPLLPPCL